MLRKVTCVLAVCLLMMTTMARAEGPEIKVGYLFNYQDGERKPIVATPLKTWENIKISKLTIPGPISLDFWATDLDQLTKGLQEDWSGGLDLVYTLPIELAKGRINISIGYGIGAKSPFADKAELIHGATVFGISYKF